MADFKNLIVAHIDVAKPVPEICSVISAIMPYHPGQEKAILQGVQEAIGQRLIELKGDVKRDGKQVLQPGTGQQNQG